MSIYETGSQELSPVTDWVHDWDWLDDQWGPNAIDIWNQVRSRGRWRPPSATGGPTCRSRWTPLLPSLTTPNTSRRCG
ncbi:MAG: hypothetical protein R2710_25680 [Acidimicrobiales bacterium]